MIGYTSISFSLVNAIVSFCSGRLVTVTGRIPVFIAGKFSAQNYIVCLVGLNGDLNFVVGDEKKSNFENIHKIPIKKVSKILKMVILNRDKVTSIIKKVIKITINGH